MNLAQTAETRSKYLVKKTDVIIYEFYQRHFPHLVAEWGTDFKKLCPIHRTYLSKWQNNLLTTGCIEKDCFSGFIYLEVDDFR